MIYRLGAGSGVWMGLAFCLLAVCFFASVKVPDLSVLLFVLVLLIIPLEIFLMRRFALRSPSFRSVSALWMFGIVTFICGSLIAALFSAVYMIYIEPGFIHHYFDHTLDLLKQTGNTDQYETLQTFRNVLPGPMDFVETMFWTSTFFGSVLSLLLALLLPFTKLIIPKSSEV